MCSQSSVISLHRLPSTYYSLRRREEHAYDIPLAEAQAPLVIVPFILEKRARHKASKLTF